MPLRCLWDLTRPQLRPNYPLDELGTVNSSQFPVDTQLCRCGKGCCGPVGVGLAQTFSANECWVSCLLQASFLIVYGPRFKCQHLAYINHLFRKVCTLDTHLFRSGGLLWSSPFSVDYNAVTLHSLQFWVHHSTQNNGGLKCVVVCWSVNRLEDTTTKKRSNKWSFWKARGCFWPLEILGFQGWSCGFGFIAGRVWLAEWH